MVGVFGSREPAEAAGAADKTRGRRAAALVGGLAMVALAALALVLILSRDDEAKRAAIPPSGSSFQYQLGDLPVDDSVNAEVFDIDLFETPKSTVESLQADGHTVVCYLNAGSFEDVRPDSDRFPDEILGEPVEGFADELWLDARRLDTLMPIMEDRLDLCSDKGFDGVEFDNVDAYANNSGFDLSAADGLSYLRALSQAARERDLSPGLKNALTLIPDVVDDFDWALVEQCFEFDECDLAEPFVDAGKAVFVVEYEGDRSDVCNRVPTGMTVVFKTLDLGLEFETCP